MAEATPPHIAARRENLFMVLAALFTASLVSCNLIANKFVMVPLGFHTWIVSAGVLAYPLTFLVTDILSEVYGRRRANQVVLASFSALVFTVIAVKLGGAFTASERSPVGDKAYTDVFNNSTRIIAASMFAYLCAQFVDIKLFHFWRKKTRGRHLWLRNNASTMFSQLVDSVLVVGVIFVGKESWSDIGEMILMAWSFKVVVAAADTPLCYLAIGGLRRIGIEPIAHDAD